MQQTIRITGTKPFSQDRFLNITFAGPTGPGEGVVWEQELFEQFKPGNELVLEVGTEADKAPISWGDYKGKARLNIRKGAQIAFAAGAAQPTGAYVPPAAAYTPPAAHMPAQHQQAPVGASGGKGEGVVERSAELVAHFYNMLKQQGLPEELCQKAASQAPQVVALWWFGEKGA